MLETCLKSKRLWSGDGQFCLMQQPLLEHMHAILQQYIFTKHVKDAKTYMPDREEDERSAEDKGKHIAKGSESKHNWEETGRKISRRENGARAKLDWMNGSSYGARKRESIVFFIKIFATMCCKPRLQFSAVVLPYSRMNTRKSSGVSILRELQHCCEVPVRSRHLWTVKQMMR